jgi:hypothetical protein
MALTDGNGSDMVMPVAPLYGGGYGGGNGFGNSFGGDWGWIILLLLLAGVGNNGWGGGFGGGVGGFAADGAMLYPWMNQAEITTDGFRDQMLNNNVTSIRDGIGNLSTQLCNCCSDVQMSLANGFAGVEQGANARQIANMQTAFGLQNAVNSGFNALGSQFADCCCENRLGIADLRYTIATENCADRAAISDGIRDVIANQTAGVQRILDQLCSDKIDAKNDEIAQLRQELLYSRGQASQVAQNSTIIDGIYNRLNQCPVGTVPVYGEQPIFTCPNNNGCGCGCGGNF